MLILNDYKHAPCAASKKSGNAACTSLLQANDPSPSGKHIHHAPTINLLYLIRNLVHKHHTLCYIRSSLISGLFLKNSGKTILSEKAQPTGKVSPTTAH